MRGTLPSTLDLRTRKRGDPWEEEEEAAIESEAVPEIPHCSFLRARKPNIYQSLSERFQRAADQLKGIEAECARRAHKRSELETFIKNLHSREMPIEEFDAMLWMSMVKRVMVEVDGSMRFTFANEMEVII